MLSKGNNVFWVSQLTSDTNWWIMCQLFYLTIYPKIRLFLLIIISELRWVNQGGKSNSRKDSKAVILEMHTNLFVLLCWDNVFAISTVVLRCNSRRKEIKSETSPSWWSEFFFKGRACKSFTLILSKKLNRFVVLSICLL